MVATVARLQQIEFGPPCFGFLASGEADTSTGVSEHPQEFPVPCRGDSLTCRVGPRYVCTRADAGVALLANVPVLAVGLVPEPDRVVGVERWCGGPSGQSVWYIT